VNHRAHGDEAKRHTIARFDFRAFAAANGRANLDTNRCEDVALFAVLVMQQSDASGPVRVILDAGNLRRHTIFITLEVDQTILTLVTAANPTACDATVVIAPALFVQGTQQ